MKKNGLVEVEVSVAILASKLRLALLPFLPEILSCQSKPHFFKTACDSHTLMKYGAVNFLLGIGFCFLGYNNPSKMELFIWLGFSFLWLGLAYFFHAPSLLGKRYNGTIAWWSRVAFLPLHILLHAVWHLTRIWGRENSTDIVLPKLTVGRRLLAAEIPAGIEVIVDLTCEFTEPVGVREGRDYRLFPMLDASVPDINLLRKFIGSLPQKSVLVHCAQGHGRTGLFAVAYLVERKICKQHEEALELLSRIRPGISLNREQRAFVAKHYGRGNEI